MTIFLVIIIAAATAARKLVLSFTTIVNTGLSEKLLLGTSMEKIKEYCRHVYQKPQKHS